MKRIKCVVIDDEELARNLLKTYIEKLDFLELLASYENPLQALDSIRSGDVQLLFLDIQMPEIKGTDFAGLLPDDLKIIFTTAYSEYAVKGFELNAMDYLLKPITFERFLSAVNRIKPGEDIPFSNTSITVKSGYELHKLLYDNINYIQSDSEYVIYYTEDGKLMSNQSLKKLEELLPKNQFIRVHRSYIVNSNKVTALKGRDLILGAIKIPVSERYYNDVKELF